MKSSNSFIGKRLFFTGYGLKIAIVGKRKNCDIAQVNISFQLKAVD